MTVIIRGIEMDKIKLITEPTPFQKLQYSVSDTNIYMKRDDLIGFGGGGNKVRLFEYIAQDIRRSGAKKIITYGSIHSNHVRVAAVVASLMRLKCDLIILRDDNKISRDYLSPNLKLIRHCSDARLEFCKTEDAHEFIDKYLECQSLEEEKYYWIPGGGHMDLALQGYADAGNEIIDQSEKLNIKPDAVFLPCGTGTTQAGLIMGLSEKMPVYGITVARSVDRCIGEIRDLLSGSEKEYAKSINVLPNPVRYGEKNSLVDEMIAEIVKSDGVFLDPVYNAKSFLVMMQYVKNNTNLKNVVYVNTGGYPNLFV